MLSLNMQPMEKQVLDADGKLDIVDLWYTIQGEGPFAGQPAVFVRLAGCNLQCPACDTDYTNNRRLFSVEELVRQVGDLSSRGLVVLTGGEPFRQNIAPLLWALIGKGRRVQIETNGTYCLDDVWGFPYAHFLVALVCSPKTGNIHSKLRPFIKNLKYVLASGKIDTEDGLPTDSLGAGVRVARPWPGFKGTIYVQPLDVQDEEENKKHIQAAVDSCLQHGYTLCLQVHKIVGLR